MFEGIVLGIIQGIAEWLPISSEGMIALAEANFFGKTNLSEIIRFALFLHLGTFLATLFYLRRDVLNILKSIIKYNESSEEEKNIVKFLLITTVVGGGAGYIILKGVTQFESSVEFSGRLVTALVGLFLIITAWLQLKKRAGRNDNKITLRKAGEVRLTDSLLLGFMQAAAVLPGLSRSGLTISTLLLRKVDDEDSLRLSFLMSLPIVLFGNIFLNFDMLTGTLSATAIWGLVFSFIFGLLTIYAGIFGILMILAAVI
jgi:undecaprenyl-diphosphatase